MKKRIPIGIDDYKDLIDNNHYYVDKTLLVKELFEDGGKVTLIPRPRRFGKTINLSMLRYFFEKTGTSTAYLFEDKAIWQNSTYRAMQGKHYVISISLKEAKYNRFEDVYAAIVNTISREVRRHKPSLHGVLDPSTETRIDALINKTATMVEYADSLYFLSELLAKACKHNTIILLDEYDTPIHAAYHNGFYNEAINFIRNLLGAAFKGNEYLERGVITGIIPSIHGASSALGTSGIYGGIFSGLNNLSVHDMFDEKFSDKFGFTEPEVEKLLENQELTQHRDNVKTWYNGYTFGARNDIYNPWSVLECLDNGGTLNTYWSNTSDNKLIKKLLTSASVEVKQSLELLLQKKESEFKEIIQGIVFPDVKTSGETALWSFLIFSGYLTLGQSKQEETGQWMHTLRIPNKEIGLLYRNLLQSSVNQFASNKVPALLTALTTGDYDTVEELLSDFVLNSMSFYDLPEKQIERSYHLFVLGLLVGLEGRYNVQSNRESGYGRYDVMLIPHNPTHDAGVIIEFKRQRIKRETLEEAAHSALKQVNDKQYAVQLHSAGCSTIYQYGIAFLGKKMMLVMETKS